MFLIGRVTALTVLLAASTATAQELCVTCSDPPATYRCGFPQSAVQTTAGLQLLCIREAATRGGHKSCSIERTRATACDGPLVSVDVPDNGAIAPPPAVPAQNQPEAPPPPPKLESTSQPPATVEEMAKATAEQSKKDWEAANAKVKETTDNAGQNIKKAGSAVGGAVKKSWDCVVSLFSSC